LRDFRFGLMIGDFPEDGSRGAEFASRTINYLKEVGEHYDSIWVPDHLTQVASARGPELKDVIEGMTTISYISAIFPKHKVGTAVVCNNFRNPALTAKMSATLDVLTGGRFILGIGAGWHKPDYEQYGYPFPSNKVRLKQLEEAVRVIKGMWREDGFSFQGKYYVVKDVSGCPKPRNPRLMIGGGGEALTLGVVAKYADLWNLPEPTPESFRRKADLLNNHCIKYGRDVDEIGKSIWSVVVLAESDAEASRLAATTDFQRGFSLIIGSPRTVVSRFNKYIDAGVESFITLFVPFPDTHASMLFAEEVMPELNLPP